MRTYFVLSQNAVFAGSFSQCYRYSIDHVLYLDEPCKFAVARPESKHARIVGELDRDGYRFISNGRKVPIRSLRSRHEQKKQP